MSVSPHTWKCQQQGVILTYHLLKSSEAVVGGPQERRGIKLNGALIVDERIDAGGEGVGVWGGERVQKKSPLQIKIGVGTIN